MLKRNTAWSIVHTCNKIKVCYNFIALLPLSCDVQSVLLSGDNKLFSFFGLTMKNVWIKKFDAAWPHLAVRIISVGVSGTVNWPALHVSGPCRTQKSLRNSQERKHGLESWHFLTWSQNSCHSVQCEFPYDRALCHAFISVTLFLLHCHVQTFFSAHLCLFLCGRNLLVPQQSLSCAGWRVLLCGMWHIYSDWKRGSRLLWSDHHLFLY